MGLESTIICVDNSEYTRNGDYPPTRLQAQQDAVSTICRFKLRSNPENNVGIITLSNNAEIVTTLTSDVSKILTSLHQVQPGGLMNLLTGLRIAHLALKHRSSRAHRMRVVAFVGSPMVADEKEVVRVAKKLKKESVVLDIVNFGETGENQKMLEILVNTVNGKESKASHLVTIPPCSHLAGALVSSEVMASEEGGASGSQFATGAAFEFGVDPNEDPELALALRVSMEEQRQRQQEEERRTTGDAAGGDASATADGSAAPTAASTATDTAAADEANPAAVSTPADTLPYLHPVEQSHSDEEMLQHALAMSLEDGAAAATAAVATPAPPSSSVAAPDFATMSEEDQIAYAMQISLQDCEPMDVDPKPAAAAATTAAPAEAPAEEDVSAMIANVDFLESVLNRLPGVNPQSEVVKQAVDSYTGGTAGASSSTDDKDKDEEDKMKKTNKKGE